MKNIKPISNIQILWAWIKGIFPFMIPLTCAQIIFLILFFFDFINIFITIIPYGIIFVYYISYLAFIALAKFVLWLINGYKLK